MLLKHILQESSYPTLLHMTDVQDAVSIITSRSFTMTPNDDTMGDRMDVKQGNDTPIGNVNHYYLSCARSTQSSYFHMMLTEWSCVLIINGQKLSFHNKVEPYANADGDEECMGPEMEERVFSDKPILPFRGPTNQTITAIHMMNVADPAVLGRISNNHVKGRINQQQVDTLKEVCHSNGIQFIVYDYFEQYALLRGGKAI